MAYATGSAVSTEDKLVLNACLAKKMEREHDSDRWNRATS
jgi:hypothetical protein